MSAQLSRDDWKGRVGGLSYRNQAFIGGKFAPSLSGKTFDCVNPATGQVLTKVAACEQADVDAAVKAARAAFDKGTWANMPPANRKRIMLKLAELMMKNRDELALLETLDMGKPIAYSTRVDIPGSANTVQWFGEAIDKIYDEVAPTPGNVVAMITREPAGVVAAVVPWNFPLLMACWKISPALAAGNSVILKPAEQSPSPPFASPSSRPKPASPRACSTCCRASARPPARRSAATWTSTCWPSPARPRSASTS